MITLDQAREAVADLETATCADPHLRGPIERELLERASVTLRKYFEQEATRETATGLVIVADAKRLARRWPPLRIVVDEGHISLCTSREDMQKVAAKKFEESAAKFCDLMDREYPLGARS